MSEFQLVTPIWKKEGLVGFNQWVIGSTYWRIKQEDGEGGSWITLVNSTGDLEDFSPEDLENIRFEEVKNWSR
ncbi:MAG: hypothetical protein [Caudoviricetes sp.]|nr:MAG: hypothetical protein [Caudoviricetes sp.]